MKLLSTKSTKMGSSFKHKRPLLFVREGELKMLSKSTQLIEGVAYGIDNNTVIHAHTTQSLNNPKGNPIKCVFLIENGSNINDSISEIGTDKLPRLFVFSNSSRTAVTKAVLKTHSETIECEIHIIPEASNLYSRSKGLLETEILSKKRVGIIGLGSGGSPIAIELAKAGIAGFILMDFDRLELSNVARHVCGVSDLGRLKTHAVRDAILEKNPHADIKTFEIDVNNNRDLCFEALSKVDAIVCASDNDQSRFLINEIALKWKIPAFFGRAITRAIGGDVLRVRPFEGPCYSCLYSQDIRQDGGDDEEVSQESQAKKILPDYTSEKEIQTVVQVGLSSDIAPISNFIVKLVLVELSKGLDSGIKSLEEDLVSDFYIWANRRENVYESWAKLEFNFNKPSILRWYGAKIQRDPNCMVCG